VETSRRRLTRGIGFSSSLHANVQKLEVKYMHTMYVKAAIIVEESAVPLACVDLIVLGEARNGEILVYVYALRSTHAPRKS
jgi:hypothetical protein